MRHTSRIELTPARASAFVRFEQRIDAAPGLDFLRGWSGDRADLRVTFAHLVAHELIALLHERPRLNRFVARGRLVPHEGVWISWGRALRDRFDPRASFADHVAQMLSARARDPAPPLTALVPAALTRILSVVAGWIAAFGGDTRAEVPSATILDLSGARVHAQLAPTRGALACVVGRPQWAPFARPDGTVGARRELVLNWSFDARVEDALYFARSLDVLGERLESPRDPATGTVVVPSLATVRLKNSA